MPDFTKGMTNVKHPTQRRPGFAPVAAPPPNLGPYPGVGVLAGRSGRFLARNRPIRPARRKVEEDGKRPTLGAAGSGRRST